MPLILVQTDSVAGCGAVVGCSGGNIAAVPQARQATEGGTPGIGELIVTIDTNVTQAGIMFQSADNEPGKTTWEAGDWVVRLNITDVNDKVNWVATYVCRFNSACGSLAVVGSLTGQSIALGTAGVKQMTIAGAEQSANLSDEIYIVLLIQNTFTHGDQPFGFTPDQNIDTPIVLAGLDLKKIIDESLWVNEGNPRLMNMVRIKGENLWVVEGVLNPRVLVRILDEILHITEGIIRTRKLVRLIAEALHVNEGIVTFRKMLRVVDETLQISESITKLKKMVRVLNETMELTESILRSKGMIRIINETFRINENIVRLTGLLRWIDETLQIQENITRFRKMLRTVSEALNISEGVVRLKDIIKVVAENVSISEGSLIRKAMVRVVDESVSLIENIIKKLKIAGLVKIINESVRVSESVLRPRKLVRIVIEAVSISEGLLKIKRFIARMITGLLRIEAAMEDVEIEAWLEESAGLSGEINR